MWLPSLESFDKLRIDPLDRQGHVRFKRLELRQPGWEPIVLVPGDDGAFTPLQDVRRLAWVRGELRIDTSGPDSQIEVQLKKRRSVASWGRFLFADLQVQNLWLAAGMALAILAPGIALCVLFPLTRRSSAELQLVALFPLALVFFFGLYLLFEIVSAAGGNGAATVAILGPVLLLGVSGLAARRARYPHSFMVRTPFAAAIAGYVAVVVLASFIVTAGKLQPLGRMTYRSISGALTFDAFSAHDNMFQYVNGKAIADELPFETF